MVPHHQILNFDNPWTVLILYPNINANLIPQQQLIANQAYNAWYNATIAPVGQFTMDEIVNLRIAYLQAQQVLQ